VITPYPTRYITPWRLRDGTEVLLRPIRPEDEPLQHDLFYTLSEKTVKERFFSVIKDMTHKMLARFCNIDYDRETAIVAEVGEGDKKRIVGISRLIIEPGSKAEFAVLVHDDYQGKGLGKKLIEVLLGAAREKGLEEVYGVVLSENDRMLKLVKALGFTTTLQPGGITGVSRKVQAGGKGN
jgi:acetyltransferase